MWDKKKKAPVVPYLICIVVLWISVFVVSRMLTEYSVLYIESGVISTSSSSLMNSRASSRDNILAGTSFIAS